MRRRTITIPYCVALTEEDAWECLDKNKTEFFVVRCHFQLNERVLNEPHHVGEALAVYQSPKGVGHQHVIASKFELEALNSVSSIRSHLTESEQLSEFVGDLISKARLPQTLALEVKLKSKLSSKYKESFSLAEEVRESCKIRVTKEFVITNTIDPNITESIVAVPVYKRKAYDIHLAWVDYLKVHYKRSPFGLRKKCKKYPKILGGDKHKNKIKFALPISTAYFWDFLPESSKLMLEKDHRVEVTDSEQIAFGPSLDNKPRVVPFPDVATLYQVATAAFPIKWIWRKSKSSEWTADDLKKIELEEVNGKNGWWSRQWQKAANK